MNAASALPQQDRLRGSAVRENMNFEQAADYLNVAESTLRVWTSRRRVPHVKLGRRVLFRRLDLDKWMAKNLVKPVAV